MSTPRFMPAESAAELDLLAVARDRTVHFMGICGAGMSALAEYVSRTGGYVTGCDRKAGSVAPALSAAGVDVIDGHDPSHAEGIGALVVTSAVPADHPELKAARERDVPVLKRAVALGAVVNSGRVVAVAGTHGKTTTTGMIAITLEEAGLDPTAFVGGRMPSWDGGLRMGSPLYIVEADEYDRSFLALRPEIAVVTTLEPDHMEIYGSLDELDDAFLEFVDPVPDDGLLALCTDDPGVARLAERLPDERVLSYGLEPGARLRAERLHADADGTSFQVSRDGDVVGPFRIGVPGRHNVQNALATLAVALHAGAAPDAVRHGLERFAGVARRFQKLADVGGVLVIDDYAHHPTEVAATLAAARERYSNRRLVAVFQPHLYSRTRDHWERFGQTLSAADVIWVTDVYPAREEPIPGITGELVADAAREAGGQVVYDPEIDGLATRLTDRLESGDVCVLMGAGDISDQAHALVARLQEVAE